MVSYYSDQTAARRGRSVSVRRVPEAEVTPISYYERESRRKNRALRDELRGAEAAGLLELAVQRGHSWDTIGLATAIHALALKVRDKSASSQEILRDERWQRLCSLSFARLVEGEARNLANVAWSLANILERDVPFQTHLAQLVMLRVEELKTQEISNLMWSTATLRFYHAPMISSLLLESIKQIGLFSPQDAANSLWALATLSKSGDTDAVKCLLGSAMNHVDEFKPQECANSIWALANLSFNDLDLVRSIAMRACDTLTEFRNQNLSNFIWAFAKLGHRDEETTMTFLQLSQERLATFSPQDLTTTVWSLATMEHRDDGFLALAMFHLHQRGQVKPLHPQHMSNTFWSLAVLGYTAAPTFEFLCDSMQLRIKEFKPQEIANFIWSMATTGYQCPKGLDCLLLRVEDMVHEFSCQSTANFVWSYAKLGLDDPKVIHLIESAATRKLHSFSEQDLSTTLWAFGTMLSRNDLFLENWMEAVSEQLQERGFLKPQHTSNILWAMASMIFYDTPFYTALTRGIQKSIQSFAPQDLACSIWACATVVHRDPTFTDLVAQRATAQLRQFDAQSVGNTVWGAAYLKTSEMNMYDALSNILDESRLSCYNEKVLAMITRALMTEPSKVEESWQLFHQLQRLHLNPGISALSLFLHRSGHLQPSLSREMQVMSVLARFQPCRYVQQAILNAAAMRLAEVGFLADAVQLLEGLLEVNGTNVVARRLREKLALGHFRTGGGGPLNIQWQLPPRTLGHTGPDYDKQCRLLEHVLCTAQVGDAWSVVETIEGFSVDGNGWLKIAGGGKGVVLDDLVTKLAPQPTALVLEFGCFVGYSSTRMAYWLRQNGGKLLSVEVDPIHVCIARNVHEFAGVADVISVCTGYSEDVIPHLKTTLGANAAADAIFFDQRGTRFHTDLWMLETEGLLKDGCAVLADNVLKPGAPHFLWYLQQSSKYELTVVSLREFAADRIEDWMALGIYNASAADFMVPAPKSLDRVAFLTDKARARSCNADGPCEVDEDAWARHAQEIRQAYDEVQIHPRIAHILQSPHGDGKPFVDWSGLFAQES